MVSWPIRAAIDTGLFDKVYVSTDSHEIADVASWAGAEILWRPELLADHYTGTTQVIQDILEKQLSSLSDKSWIYKIYATSPITDSLLKEFVDYVDRNAAPFTVSVGRFRTPIEKAMQMSPDGRLTFLNRPNIDSRSQDLEGHFFDAGKLYAAKVSSWKEATSPLLENPKGFEIPNWASVDIDTEEDWSMAEALFTQLRGKVGVDSNHKDLPEKNVQ